MGTRQSQMKDTRIELIDYSMSEFIISVYLYGFDYSDGVGAITVAIVIDFTFFQSIIIIIRCFVIM